MQPHGTARDCSCIAKTSPMVCTTRLRTSASYCEVRPAAKPWSGFEAMNDTWWWVLALALITIGVAGTFLPGIPGVIAVFCGMALAAWIDDFERIHWATVVVLGALKIGRAHV